MNYNPNKPTFWQFLTKGLNKLVLLIAVTALIVSAYSIPKDPNPEGPTVIFWLSVAVLVVMVLGSFVSYKKKYR